MRLKEKILGPGHQHLMGQDCIGDHGEGRLDEGRADGQKPNLASCLGIHHHLTPEDRGQFRADGMNGRARARVGRLGPGRPVGWACSASPLQTSKGLTRSATFDFLWMI